MPHRNRVLPTGQIVADTARGTFTGNRGILVDLDGTMSNRQWAATAWITCLLDFRDLRRPIAQPRTWTELFFLDEAVAFAAGHRPCAYCRRSEYNVFKGLWGGARAVDMDATLHTERLEGREKRLHDVELGTLPDGAFAMHDGMPRLVMGDHLLRYTTTGYDEVTARPTGHGHALTPPSILRILAAGYQPALHKTATLTIR